MITTKYFRISSSTYVRHCFSVWAEKWWWTLVLPLAVLLFLGLNDARFFIVTLVLLLIVYPGILALLYFNYALRPAAAYALLSRRLEFSEKEIVIVYAPNAEYRTPLDEHISYDAISKIEDSGDAMLLVLRSSDYDFIIVPAESFAKGEFAKSYEIFKRHSKHIPLL